MPRVAVIGSGRAGKATFAAELGRRLSREVVHLDHLYWGPGWVPTAAEEWRAIQQELVARPDWIIDGNYASTLDLRLAAADVVVLFDVPRLIAVGGILRRRLSGRGRAVQAPGCSERLTLEFLCWVWRYPRVGRPRALAAVAAHASTAELVVVRSRQQAREALAHLAGSPSGSPTVAC